jgi:hypothetical protein
MNLSLQIRYLFTRGDTYCKHHRVHYARPFTLKPSFWPENLGIWAVDLLIVV